MKTWEYTTIKNRRSNQRVINERLNEMGQNGWELITTASYDIGAYMFVFKREII